MSDRAGPRPRHHTAEVVVECESAAVALAVAGALQPEVREGPEGAEATATAKGTAVVLAIAAPDLSALRASLQSLLRLGEAARAAASLP